MNAQYEVKIANLLAVWEKKSLKKPGVLERTAKKVGDKINAVIPQKVQDTITAAVRTIIRTSLFGAEYTPRRSVQRQALDAADDAAAKVISLYQKVATAEGAGTGAGGFMLAMVDFPALIAIKMKLLFELAHVYGYDTNRFAERIFVLKLFQFAFSGADKRVLLLQEFKQWHDFKAQWSGEREYYEKLDWEEFQKEYRDAIDFKKMLTLIPGVGAVTGAWANYSIVEELGEHAMNVFRLRRLAEKSCSLQLGEQ